MNLLSNALKFTPENGKINVSVEQEEYPRGENWVRTHFWIKDNGIGMTFHVALDFEKADVKEEEMILPNWNMPVVDDDEELCRDAVTNLSEIGIQAQYTMSGEEAVNLVKVYHEKRKDFHIVLIDWKMPDMDGIQIAKNIRQEVGG